MSGALSSRIGERAPRSSLRFILELLRLLRWWQRMQATPVGYILENVPPLGTVDPQVQADAQLVCRYLGKPVAVDAATLDLMSIGFDGSGRI